MTLNKNLLQMLVCPVTKQSLALLDDARLTELNRRIARGEVQSLDGKTLAVEFARALVTQNGALIYPLVDNVPVMLEEKSVAVAQFSDWR